MTPDLEKACDSVKNGTVPDHDHETPSSWFIAFVIVAVVLLGGNDVLLSAMFKQDPPDAHYYYTIETSDSGIIYAKGKPAYSAASYDGVDYVDAETGDKRHHATFNDVGEITDVEYAKHLAEEHDASSGVSFLNNGVPDAPIGYGVNPDDTTRVYVVPDTGGSK